MAERSGGHNLGFGVEVVERISVGKVVCGVSSCPPPQPQIIFAILILSWLLLFPPGPDVGLPVKQPCAGLGAGTGIAVGGTPLPISILISGPISILYPWWCCWCC